MSDDDLVAGFDSKVATALGAMALGYFEGLKHTIALVARLHLDVYLLGVDVSLIVANFLFGSLILFGILYRKSLAR